MEPPPEWGSSYLIIMCVLLIQNINFFYQIFLFRTIFWNRLLGSVSESSPEMEPLPTAVRGDHHISSSSVFKSYFAFYVFYLYFIFYIGGDSNILNRLGTLPQKNTGFFGNFLDHTPPLPPFWELLFPKQKKCGLFCVLGPSEHFWSSQKYSLLVTILTYTCGNRWPPQPSQRKKIPKLLVFANFFQKFPDFESRVIWLNWSDIR